MWQGPEGRRAGASLLTAPLLPPSWPRLQVETRATGAEREVGAGEVEHLGTTERVVGVTGPKAPCE